MRLFVLWCLTLASFYVHELKYSCVECGGWRTGGSRVENTAVTLVVVSKRVGVVRRREWSRNNMTWSRFVLVFLKGKQTTLLQCPFVRLLPLLVRVWEGGCCLLLEFGFINHECTRTRDWREQNQKPFSLWLTMLWEPTRVVRHN